MKLLITFIGYLCLTVSLSAQENNNIINLFTQYEYSTNSENDLLFICRVSIENEKLKEKEEWKKSILIDYDNKAHKVESHYNVSKDEIKILLQNQIRTVLPQKIKAIKVGEMILVPCDFEGEEALVFGYFQVMSSNKIDLLKRFENEGEKVKRSFYTRKKDEAAKPLKLSKACILKYLDDERTSKFVKDRKLNPKNEEDLLILFNYYNEIK